MHKSRLAGFIIDCNADNIEAAADFWSHALGYPVRPGKGGEDPDYVLLDSGSDGINVEVQRVSHPSRVHLDIETDDVDAEVARLEKLGARRIEQVKTWWVMEAPSGHRFCVVQPQRDDFATGAREWDDG